MKKIIVAAVIGAVSAAFAEGEATFGGWRLSVGGNMAFGAKAKARYNGGMYRANPGDPNRRFDPGSVDGGRYDFDNGAYIDTAGADRRLQFTRNWRIPKSMTSEAGSGDDFQRTLNFSNTELDGRGSSSDDGMALGASLELSRTLYASENGLGVDLAIGASWIMCNDVLGGGTRGLYNRTTYGYAPTGGLGWDPDFATYNGDWYGAGADPAAGQGDVWYGNGWSGPTPSAGSYSTRVSGDYDEVELSLMLKPWYEITDWWRIYGTIGLGLGCGMFDFAMNAVMDNATIYRMSADECEWDFYGIAGGGTVFRLGSFDISVDVLYRFCQDDIGVSSEYVSCSLEKPDLVLRVGIGYEF